jgi:hypothetical protein
VAVTASVEQEIVSRGLTAPRVTLRDIENAITHEFYFVVGEAIRRTTQDLSSPEAQVDVPAVLNRVTMCVLVLQNGFSVTGESATVSSANFDAELGRTVARQDAVRKMWPLMGFLLATDLYRQASQIQPPVFHASANY